MDECFICCESNPTLLKNICNCTDRSIHCKCLEQLVHVHSHANGCPVCKTPYTNVRVIYRTNRLKILTIVACCIFISCGILIIIYDEPILEEKIRLNNTATLKEFIDLMWSNTGIVFLMIFGISSVLSGVFVIIMVNIMKKIMPLIKSFKIIHVNT